MKKKLYEWEIKDDALNVIVKVLMINLKYKTIICIILMDEVS